MLLSINHGLLSQLLKIIVPVLLLVDIWHICDLIKYQEYL